MCHIAPKETVEQISPSGGDAAAGGRRGAFPSPAGRFACFPRAKPGCMVLPPTGGIYIGAARRRTSPTQWYFITPWAEPSTSPEGEADPGLNPWRPGPKARRRHQPSRRSRVNLREYRQAPIPPQKPMASSIAHSKKHRSSDWCFFIIPVHAGLHGRHGHVLRDVRPPLPLQI